MTTETTGNEVVDAQFGETETATDQIDVALADKQTSEAAADDTTEQPQEDVDFSKKFAALSRKEKDLRSRETDYDTKMAELQARLDELESSKTVEPEPAPELPLEYRIKKDPLGTLAELGLDYEALTNLALNDGKLSNDMQMKLMREEMEGDYRKKFEDLETRLNEKEKAEEESRYDKVINDFKSEIETVVNSDSEAYELIQANNATDLVYDVIESHYNENNRVLDVKEAAEAVESYLEEEARKLLKLKKLTKSEEVEEVAVKPNTQSSPTLTNDHSAMSQNQTDKKLSSEESVYNAAKMLKWDS